ncbi:hypothetical protein [Micromonospora sp. S-DT3-3-22]|uniref:hypothetical protein n=1 Tax=Micromonospora sp. S-DT3-3-22 TaxID=2755359 RepID=UPI001E64A4B8|nr:hypothetical protein [Micromonospora sp. S-DT3-3-22]
MPSTVGQWLVVILALLVGLAGGWALWGRQKPTAAAPIVEGDPVVGLTPEEKAAATIDAPRPAATVDTSPAPAAIVDEPTPHVAPDADHPTPTTTGSAAAVSAGSSAAPDLAAPAESSVTSESSVSSDSSAASGSASTSGSAPSAVEDVAVNGTSSTVAADRTAPLPDLADEPTTLDLTGRATPDDAPGSGVTGETTAPVPAPRATVEDTPDSAAADLPEPTPVDPGQVTATPVTASDVTPVDDSAPVDEPTPATDSALAGESSSGVASTPVDESTPVDVAGSSAGVAEPQPAGGAEAEPAGAPEHTSPRAVDVDDAPVAAEPVIPTQRTPDADSAPVPDNAPVSDSAPVARGASVAEGAAAQDEPVDDFRRIQGVGPKMAAALQAAGIRSYRQLAALDETSLRETIRAAGLRATASLATWPQQAQVLAGAGAEAERVLPTPTGTDSQD